MQVNHGDEIYFHHKGTPKSGKVVCAGKHGCTVKSGDEEHKLKWQHIAGFKKRTHQRYKVLEEGEDGLIVEDEQGRKRLVHIPPEARADQLSVEKK